MYHHNIKSAPSRAIFFFLPIPNHESYYADYEGNIYSARRRRLTRLTPKVERNGYLHVLLYDGRGGRVLRYVHQLVLETFVGPRPTGMLACHTPDPDKSNNRADNLAWQTRLENGADARRDGTVGDGRKKLDPTKVRTIRQMSAEGVSNAEIGRRMAVGPDTVRMVVRRETWRWVEP